MLIGHQIQWQYLRSLAETGGIPHAFLFSGPEGIGKKRVALEWVKLLFGEKNQRGIEEGFNQDAVVINPVFSSSNFRVGKPSIKISQIRELSDYFNLQAAAAPFKVAIINDVHQMRKDAQSAFLKLLEEPRGNTIFILITSFPNMLLSTILSRVQNIKFYNVPKAEIENYLLDIKASRRLAVDVLNFYNGRPGQVFDFLSNPEAIEERKKRREDFTRLRNADISFRFQYVGQLSKDPQRLNEILDFWLFSLREDLFYGSEKTGTDRRYFLELKNKLRFVEEIKFLISTTNINPKLALEVLMLDF